MRLYDNESYREEFMERVYELLHEDGTNDRANEIIRLFDEAPVVEGVAIEDVMGGKLLSFRSGRMLYITKEDT